MDNGRQRTENRYLPEKLESAIGSRSSDFCVVYFKYFAAFAETVSVSAGAAGAATTGSAWTGAAGAATTGAGTGAGVAAGAQLQGFVAQPASDKTQSMEIKTLKERFMVIPPLMEFKDIDSVFVWLVLKQFSGWIRFPIPGKPAPHPPHPPPHGFSVPQRQRVFLGS